MFVILLNSVAGKMVSVTEFKSKFNYIIALNFDLLGLFCNSFV